MRLMSSVTPHSVLANLPPAFKFQFSLQSMAVPYSLPLSAEPVNPMSVLVSVAQSSDKQGLPWLKPSPELLQCQQMHVQLFFPTLSISQFMKLRGFCFSPLFKIQRRVSLILDSLPVTMRMRIME